MNKRKTKKKKEQDLYKQFRNLVANGGLAHKYISEPETLFLAAAHFNCPIKSIVQGQVLATIRHVAFYNYTKTASEIRLPKLKRTYHNMVNSIIFRTYPWVEKYKHKKSED